MNRNNNIYVLSAISCLIACMFLPVNSYTQTTPIKIKKSIVEDSINSIEYYPSSIIKNRESNKAIVTPTLISGKKKIKANNQSKKSFDLNSQNNYDSATISSINQKIKAIRTALKNSHDEKTYRKKLKTQLSRLKIKKKDLKKNNLN